MKRIRAAEIEKKFPGTGRHIGAKLAEHVNPGDVIDFEGFITTTNSFADEFVKVFIRKHGREAFHSLKFENANEFLLTLLVRAFKRRKDGRPQPPKIGITWQPVSEIPF